MICIIIELLLYFFQNYLTSLTLSRSSHMTTPQPTPGSLAYLLEQKQTLEGNVQSLSQLRDQLALALATMEQNTDRISAWLKDNREEIIVARHQLMRTIARKDIQAFNKLVYGDGMTTIAGFVPADPKNSANQHRFDIIRFLLSDGEIMKATVSSFGEQDPFVITLNNIPAGLPASLIEALPVMHIPDDIAQQVTQAQSVVVSNPTPATTPSKDSKKNKTGILSGWFKDKAQRETEQTEQAYQGMLNHWRQIHRDLMGLQSDRHYYIDSFMEWVGENLSPSKPDQNFAAIMTQYRHPAYVIARAQEDYDHVLTVHTKALLDEAAVYSKVAQLLDTQDIAAFIKEMPVLFPRPDTQPAAEMRRLLLADFAASSFVDIALEHVKTPSDRLALFEAAMAFEDQIKIKGSTKPPAIYQTILTAVADDKTLPLQAITLVLRHFARNNDNAHLHAIVNEGKTFSKLMTLFGHDDAQYILALEAVLSGFGNSVNVDCAADFVTLRRAILNKDGNALAHAMTCIHSDKRGMQARALWDLSMPVNFVERLEQACGHYTPLFVNLLIQALSLGLAREVVIEGRDDGHDNRAFEKTLDILNTLISAKNIKDISPGHIVSLLAASGISANKSGLLRMRNNWHSALHGIHNDGLIERTANSTVIDDTAKLKLIAALLSPLRDNLEKVALLENVAAASLHGSSTHAHAAGLLRDAARALIGDIYPAHDGAFLSNPENIANIWYDKEKGGTIFFTVGGEIHVYRTQTDEKTANNLFDIMHHRYGFRREDMGLFNPALADAYKHFSNGSSRIFWDMHEAPLNITPQEFMALHTSPDMIHATAVDGAGDLKTYTSIHPRAVLALIPVIESKQWLLVDRNGTHQIVDSIVMPNVQGPLLHMGGAYINPDRAALISVDPTSQTVSLRVENPVFSELAGAMTQNTSLAAYSNDGTYIKISARNAAEWQHCQAALESNPDLLSPGGDYAHLLFNLNTLASVTIYTEATAAGIQYSHKKRGGLSGRIEVDTDTVSALPQMMAGLSAAAKRNSNLLVIPANGMLSDIIVHADHVHNIFYQATQGNLIMITDHDNLEHSITPKEAQRQLKHVSTLPNWTALDNRSMSLDLGRMDRATLLNWDKADNSANALIGNRVIGLGLTQEDFQNLLDQKLQAQFRSVSKVLSTRQISQFKSYSEAATAQATAQTFPPPRRSTDAQDLLALITQFSHDRTEKAPSPKKLKSGRDFSF